MKSGRDWEWLLLIKRFGFLVGGSATTAKDVADVIRRLQRKIEILELKLNQTTKDEISGGRTDLVGGISSGGVVDLGPREKIGGGMMGIA